MNERELKNILDVGETESIEFREKVNESLYKTIAGFANTNGGTIILGVDKNRKIIGVESSSQSKEDLTNQIVNKLSIYPELESLAIKDRFLIALSIARSTVPISCAGRYYERVGTSTREMNPQKLRAFLLRSTSWDSAANDFALEEIDRDAVHEFVHLAVERNRLTDLAPNEPLKVLLQKLALTANEKLTNGAILLFGKTPQKRFANHCVRIGRLKTETTIIDDKWVRGNLFQQFDQTLTALRQYVGVRYEIKEVQRKDVWEYPIPALREAVLNALIHRDYFDPASFIQIKVYDDYIWISNHGGLPGGLTVEALTKPHKSYPRNPLLAKIFYLAGYIEQFGSGTLRILEWMKEAGLPEPTYKEEMGGFSVYLYKEIHTEESIRKMGLNERQIKAFDYIKAHGKITNKEYQEVCKTSERTATRDLADMVTREIFAQVGITGKGTSYILKTPPQRRQRRQKAAT